MKKYMEVGEYGMFDKKRYRCVKDDIVDCCRNYCDLDDSLCGKVLCDKEERPDRMNVHFRLTRKFRKGGWHE